MSQSPNCLPVVLSLGIIQIIALASSIYLLAIVGEPISRDLNIPPTVLYGLMSLGMLLTAILTPLTGKWLDRRGGREVQLCSSLFYALALVTLGLAQGTVSLMIALAMLGVAVATGNYGTVFKIVIDVFEDKARPLIASVAFIGGLGSALGWPFSAYLTDAAGWRGTCFTWAMLHIILCLPLAVWIGEPVVPKPRDRPAGRVQWDRRMLQLTVIVAGGAFLASSMSTHLPRLLAQLGLEGNAAAAAGLMGIAASLARVMEFTVMRKWPPLVATRLACIVHPLCALCAVTMAHVGVYLLPAGQGISNGLITVATGVLPLALFGPRDYGYRSSLVQLPARFVQAGGPLVFGMLLSQSAGVALGFTSLICLVMLAMTFGLTPSAPPE